MTRTIRRFFLLTLVVAAAVTLRPGSDADRKLDRALRERLAANTGQSFRVFVRGRANEREALTAVSDLHGQVIEQQAQLHSVTAQVTR